jgi:hypothetical protein
MTTVITVSEFCSKHKACSFGRDWALKTGCANMAEIWQRHDLRTDWRVWIATRKGVLDNRTLRLFTCYCARQVLSLATDERSRNAVEVAERYALDKATCEELAAAREAAKAEWLIASAKPCFEVR